MYTNPRVADASLMGWMPVRSRRAMSWHPMAVEGEDAQPPSHRGQHVYYKVDVNSISLGETVIMSSAQIMTDTGAIGCDTFFVRAGSGLLC